MFLPLSAEHLDALSRYYSGYDEPVMFAISQEQAQQLIAQARFAISYQTEIKHLKQQLHDVEAELHRERFQSGGGLESWTPQV